MSKEKRKLVLGSIPKDFSLKTHFPLGPWCFQSNEDRVKGWDSIPFLKDPLQTKEDFKDVELKINEILYDLFPKVCEYLNYQNGMNHSSAFWRVLIYPWLSLIVQIVAERRLRIDQLPSEQFDVELVDLKNIDFINTHSFIRNGVENITFNNWIYSLVIRYLALENIKVASTEKVEFQRVDSGLNNHSFIYKTKLFVKSFFAVRTVYGLSDVSSLFMTLFVPRGSLKCSSITEKKVNVKFWMSDFDWLDLVLKCMPKCFLNLDLIKIPSVSLNYKFIILSGTLLYTEEEQKLQIASYVEKGGKIIPVQHGSNYGCLDSFKWINDVEFSNSGMITWGWSQQGKYTANFHPLPSLLVSKFKNRYVKIKKQADIILVGTSILPHNPFISSFHRPVQAIEYRKWKVKFLKELLDDVFHDVRYRYYFHSPLHFKDKDYVQRLFPNLKMCEGELHPQMGLSRLVVNDHPGTTFFLTMGANVPTVGFWNRDHWLFTDEAEDLFQKLRDVKIVFDNPVEAARFVNKIAGDINSWWKSEKVQQAREEWSQMYARYDKNCFWQWFKFIRALDEK